MIDALTEEDICEEASNRYNRIHRQIVTAYYRPLVEMKAAAFAQAMLRVHPEAVPLLRADSIDTIMRRFRGGNNGPTR